MPFLNVFNIKLCVLQLHKFIHEGNVNIKRLLGIIKSKKYGENKKKKFWKRFKKYEIRFSCCEG